jgi:Uma2 family endonuclease
MGEILERPLAPARHRLSVNAYYRMAEAGILTDPHRVELIDGEIMDMPAIGSPHAAITNRLARLFARALPDEVALVSVQSPLRLDAYNEPEGASDLLLLIEVSESSLAYDRSTKLALYAKFGVPEVWIVDLLGATVEVYREPRGGAYTSCERLAGGPLARRSSRGRQSMSPGYSPEQ